MEVPRICNGTFSGGPDGGMFRFQAGAFRTNGFAVRVPFAAGGFVFGPGQVLRESWPTRPRWIWLPVKAKGVDARS